MKPVPLEQAAGRLRELFDAAVRGEDVVVEGAGARSVRLVPIDQSKGQPTFGSACGLIAMADDFDAPLEDFDA